MALVLKKFGSFVTQMYRGDCCASSAFRVWGLLFRGLPVYTDSNVQRKENDTPQEKNVDSKEKNEKITKDEQVFSASMVVRTRRAPQPPPVSGGSGGKVH